jgi:5-methylcytosine-specific restriction endonuclease McrA
VSARSANPHNGNGHRRRQVVRRVRAEESHCALCDVYVNQELHHLDPMSGVVDEDVPRARGGSPYQRSNCHLMHRVCNRWKSTMTLAEARAKYHGAEAASTPPPRAQSIEASDIW